MQQLSGLGVVGGGAWGTALACLLAADRQTVCLWAYEEQTVKNIRERQENPDFLPGIRIPASIHAFGDLDEMVSSCRTLIMAVPAQKTRGIFGGMKGALNSEHRFVIASKGIETESGSLLSDILAEEMGTAEQVVVLSGPTFAREIALQLPSAAVLASTSEELGITLQKIFHRPWFRLYRSSDMIGVQVAGAVKNVLAIAAGIAEGLKLGLNARAALICRGLAEMTRLGMTMGAEAETFAGMSGLGDLVLTATGPLSRNHALGIRLGEGVPPEECLSTGKTVAEGAATSISIHQLCSGFQMEMPICKAVYEVLQEKKSCKEVLSDLLNREVPESESGAFKA